MIFPPSVVRTNCRSVLLARGAGGKLPGSVNCGPQPQVVTKCPAAANVLWIGIMAVIAAAQRSAELQLRAKGIRFRAELELRAPVCWKQFSARIGTIKAGRCVVAVRELPGPVSIGEIRRNVL